MTIELSGKRKIRNIARMVFAGLGSFELIMYVVSGFQDHMVAVMGMMFVMMAATNFCTQCPLLSALKQIFGFGARKSIATKKI